MKNAIILFLAATTITLGVVCVVQSRKSASQQNQVAALQGELEAQSQQLEAAQVAQKHADQQRHELMGQAEELAAQLQAHQSAEAHVTAQAINTPPPAPQPDKPDAGKGGFGNMISKMMQDPDTREFIRKQQRMMMDQLYAPLVKKMGLTPDETAQFKDLLTDNAMKGAENATSMFSGLGSTNNAEAVKTLAAQHNSFEEQVKAFLGDDRYAQYKEYQETAGERMQLNAFKMQAGSDYNLSDPQAEALLTFMKEEKKNVAATTGLPLESGGQDAAKLQSLMSGDKTDQLMQAQDTVNQRVFERARTILSPDQLDTLGKFQTNQLQMMRVGMGMMKKMFSPDNPSAAAAPPSQ